MLRINISLNKKDKAKGLKIPTNLTPNLSYLMGVFAGDGSIAYRKEKNEYSLKCVGNPNDEIDFYNIIIQSRFNNVFGFPPVMRKYDNETTYGFRVFSKSIVFFLTKYIGLPLGSKFDNLEIPRSLNHDNKLIIDFIRGLFDTDGSISFKKRYKNHPYYPVISLSSKSNKFIKQISVILKNNGFKIVEIYNYKIRDIRIKEGFTVINRIEINGKNNFRLWLDKIRFDNPKHLKKIERYWKNSEIKKK